MPNPGTLISMQAFDRETVNMVVQIPDYKLRQQLALQHKETLIVEAFTAFDEMFHLHLKWQDTCSCPELMLSSCSAMYQKLLLDLTVESPQLTWSTGVPTSSSGLFSWSTPSLPLELQRARTIIPLVLRRGPVLDRHRPTIYHIDLNVGLDQTVTFNLVGTAWKLDDHVHSSLHCKSYRQWMRANEKQPTATSQMVDNVAAMKGATDVPPDVEMRLSKEDECDETESHMVHSFVLQAHSPVFRAMLAAPMTEGQEKVVNMVGVTTERLEDFLQALYGLCVPEAVREDEERLVGLLALADCYGVIALRDNCATLLEASLNESNMARLLKVADMHQVEGLRAAALQYIIHRVDRIVAVMDSDDASVRKSVRERLRANEDLNTPSSRPQGQAADEEIAV